MRSWLARRRVSWRHAQQAATSSNCWALVYSSIKYNFILNTCLVYNKVPKRQGRHFRGACSSFAQQIARLLTCSIFAFVRNVWCSEVVAESRVFCVFLVRVWIRDNIKPVPRSFASSSMISSDAGQNNKRTKNVQVYV